MKILRSEKGFTLFEVLVVLGIFSIIMTTFFEALKTTMDAMEDSTSYTGVLLQSRSMLDDFESDFTECQIDSSSIEHVASDKHSSITIKVPIGLDADGNGYDDIEFVRLGDPSNPDYDRDANDVVWGISRGTRARYSPGTYTYAFVPDPLKEVHEDIRQMDYNFDGDKADTIHVGMIKKTESFYNYDTGVNETNTIVLCNNVIQLSTDYSSDIMNDSSIKYTCVDPGSGASVSRTGDPMFLVRDPWVDQGVPAVENTVDGKELSITLWFRYLDAKSKPHLYQVHKIYSLGVD